MKRHSMRPRPPLPAVAAAAFAVLLFTNAARAEPVGHHGTVITKWAEGLAGPQGLAADGRGGVFVVENGKGSVSRFSADGKQSTRVVEGLKAPAWASFVGGALYVSERQGNAVARVGSDGSLERLAGEIVDPLGLALDPQRPGELLVLSHRKSIVYRFAPASGQLRLQPEPVVTPAAGAAYGWRDLTLAPDGTLYVTDEVSRAVLRRKPGGSVQPWVTGLSSPSGLVFSPRGELFVTEEGGGRLSRLDADGKATVVAEGLGAARALLFLDDRTLLVSDRAGGVVWKVALAR